MKSVARTTYTNGNRIITEINATPTDARAYLSNTRDTREFEDGREVSSPAAFVEILSTFTVIAISDNTNSFGLRGVVILNEEGIAWQLGVSIASPHQLCVGEEIKLWTRPGHIDRPDVFLFSFEIPKELTPSDPAVAQRIITAAKEASESANNPSREEQDLFRATRNALEGDNVRESFRDIL